jgi:acyl-CoA thioesterase FadM
MPTGAPFSRYTATVVPDWLDRQGRLGVGGYARIFEDATRAFFRHLDISQAYRERTNHAFFALEQHITIAQPLAVGDAIGCDTRLLALSAERLVCFHVLRHDGAAAATCETLFLHVDAARGRGAPMPDDLTRRLLAVQQVHARLPLPPEAGHGILSATD